MQPHVLCLCPTFRRPEMLANLLACFQMQTYGHCDLVIVDDDPDPDSGWQTQRNEKEGWSLIRCPPTGTLAAKHNALVQLAQPQPGDILVLMDDDDVYLPWHVETHVQTILQGAHWSRPEWVGFNYGCVGQEPPFKLKYGGRLMHAAWAFTFDRFQEVGGYPEDGQSFDKGLGQRLSGCENWWHAGPVGNQNREMHQPVSCVVRWNGGNWSAVKDDRDARVVTRRKPCPGLTELRPHMDDETLAIYKFLRAI